MGFGYSIYFMLGLVFTIIGIIVFVVARTILREEKQRAAREAARKAIESQAPPAVSS